MMDQDYSDSEKYESELENPSSPSMRAIQRWNLANNPKYAKMKNILMRTRLDNEDVLSDYNAKFQQYE